MASLAKILFAVLILGFIKKSSFWNDIKVIIIKNESSKNGEANQFGSSDNLERLVNLFIYIAL